MLTSNDEAFFIQYNDENTLYRNLKDGRNCDNIGMTLIEALNIMFDDHETGALMTVFKTTGVMHFDEKYTDAKRNQQTA